MMTIPDMASLLTPLEDAIHLQLIPALTCYDSYSSILRDLPIVLVGWELLMQLTLLIMHVRVTASLKSLIVHQSLAAPPSIKADIQNHQYSANKAKAQVILLK